MLDDIGEAGCPQRVEESFLGGDQEWMERADAVRVAGALAEHAAFFVLVAVDCDDDVVDRDLRTWSGEAVAATGSRPRVEEAGPDKRRECLREHAIGGVGGACQCAAGHSLAVCHAGDLKGGAKAVVGCPGEP